MEEDRFRIQAIVVLKTTFSLVFNQTTSSYEAQLLQQLLLNAILEKVQLSLASIGAGRPSLQPNVAFDEKRSAEAFDEFLRTYSSSCLGSSLTDWIDETSACFAVRMSAAFDPATDNHRFLDLSAAFNQYSSLKSAEFTNYTDFLSNLPDIVVSTSNTQLLGAIHKSLRSTIAIKYGLQEHDILPDPESELVDYSEYVQALIDSQLYCELCHIETESPESLANHCKGKGHSLRMKRRISSVKAIQINGNKHYRIFALKRSIVHMLEPLAEETERAIEHSILNSKSSAPAGEHARENHKSTDPILHEYVRHILLYSVQDVHQVTTYKSFAREAANKHLESSELSDTTGQFAIDALVKSLTPGAAQVSVAPEKRFINRNTGEEVPRWMYVAHSLHKKYTCEVCGDVDYYGTVYFERHFNSSRHISGLRKLGVSSEFERFSGLTKVADVGAVQFAEIQP